MALGATVYTIDIDLSDSDRGVYETLALRVARHPSESDDYLVARVLAYCLEYTEGIAFSRGGLSDAARLHKACKLAPRVAVYMHRDPGQFLKNLAGERIHRAEALELYALDRGLIAALVARLERRLAFALSINERELYVSIGSETL